MYLGANNSVIKLTSAVLPWSIMHIWNKMCEKQHGPDDTQKKCIIICPKFLLNNPAKDMFGSMLLFLKSSSIFIAFLHVT